MFVQNVTLLCISMIVLGAILGYITPFIRKRFFGSLLKHEYQHKQDQHEQHLGEYYSESVQTPFEQNQSDNHHEQGLRHDSVNPSQEIAKLSNLAEQKSIELDSYRGDVKQHFVNMAKVLNNKHVDTEDLNQALISQIGVGAEQLVGAQSMKGALSQSADKLSHINDLEVNDRAESSQGYVQNLKHQQDVLPEQTERDKPFVGRVDTPDNFNNSNSGQQNDEWIAVEGEDEIDAFFDGNQESDTKKENRFQELSEGIEGKSNDALSGIKSWFNGVALRRNVTEDANMKKTYSDLAVTSIPETDVHYEDGVLVDAAVLDSQWHLDSANLKHTVIKNVSETSAVSSGGSSELYFETSQEPDTDQVDSTELANESKQSNQDFRSEHVFAKSEDNKQYDESLQNLQIQQGLEGNRPLDVPPLESVQVDNDASKRINENLNKDLRRDQREESYKGMEKNTQQRNTGDMLDPYDRITNAVLKESSKQNLNDEKKIVHELFYVRGHQSNVSGRAMSNINPGIPKDN